MQTSTISQRQLRRFVQSPLSVPTAFSTFLHKNAPQRRCESTGAVLSQKENLPTHTIASATDKNTQPGKTSRKPSATVQKPRTLVRKLGSERPQMGSRLIPLHTLDPATKDLVSRFREALKAPEVNPVSLWAAYLELAQNKQALQSLHTFHDQRALFEGLLTYRDREIKIAHISQALLDLAKASVGDQYNYVYLSRAYGPTLTYDKAISILEQIKADGLEPNTIIYGNFLHQLTIAERWDDFNRIWDDMDNRFIEKDAGIMKAMTWACLKQRQPEKGEEYLERAARMGDIDKNAWMALFEAYSADGYEWGCQRVLNKLKQREVEVDERMYSTLVAVSLAKDNLAEANRLMNRALKNFSPEGCVVILRQFAKYLCDRSEPEKAEALMERAKGKGLKPDLALYVVVINGYASQGDVDEAKRLYYQMEEEGIQPGREAKTVMLKAYAKASKVEYMQLAEDLVKEIEEVDAQVCVTMADGYLKCHYAGGARKWIDKMKELDVRPEVKKTLKRRFRQIAALEDHRRLRANREVVWDEVEQDWVDARQKRPDGFQSARRVRRPKSGDRRSQDRVRDDDDRDDVDRVSSWSNSSD